MIKRKNIKQGLASKKTLSDSYARIDDGAAVYSFIQQSNYRHIRLELYRVFIV